ncbi:hypothetical protein Dimus_010856, partial [Dionaea muscipula]
MDVWETQGLTGTSLVLKDHELVRLPEGDVRSYWTNEGYYVPKILSRIFWSPSDAEHVKGGGKALHELPA